MMAIKNLDKLKKDIIALEFTSILIQILKDLVNALEIIDKNTYLTSQDIAFNIKFLQEVSNDNIRVKSFVLMKIIQSNPIHYLVCRRNDLVTKSIYPYSSHQERCQKKL